MLWFIVQLEIKQFVSNVAIKFIVVLYYIAYKYPDLQMLFEPALWFTVFLIN